MVGTNTAWKLVPSLGWLADRQYTKRLQAEVARHEVAHPRGRRRWRYPLIGMLVAQGAPLGLMLLRAAHAGQLPTPAWCAAELGHDPLLYAYLSASTSLAFAVIGRTLGRFTDRLQDLAITDTLTRLYNRRHFELRLREELERTDRYQSALSLLIVDVDGLKPVNDQHGHEAGDAALCSVAEALRATCRASDIVARLGGDEFAVLAPFTRAPEAVDLAERIRNAVNERAAPWGKLTVSVGVADAEQTRSRHPQALLAAADRALYVAKSSGRNRSSLAPPSAGTRAAAHSSASVRAGGGTT